jgi:hypothetical protein
MILGSQITVPTFSSQWVLFTFSCRCLMHQIPCHQTWFSFSTADGAGGGCLICRLVPAQACLTNTPPERCGTFTLCTEDKCSSPSDLLKEYEDIFTQAKKWGAFKFESSDIEPDDARRNVTSVLSPRFCVVNFERKLDSKQARSGPWWCALFHWLARLLFDSDGSTYYCRHCRHIPRSKKSTIPDLNCIVPSCEKSTPEGESEQPWCSAGQLEVCILRIWHLT